MKVPHPKSWIHKQPGGVGDPTGQRDGQGDGGDHDGDSRPHDDVRGDGSKDRIGTENERKRADHLQAIIDRKREKEEQRPRKDRFLPFLLVRSAVGDHGNRPFGAVFWESPDIWVAAGDPTVTPALPSSPGGSVVAGQANTIYAHVWNLGKAPIAGVVVEFYWFDPSLAIDGAHAHRIGYARVDLGPRNSPTCHKLVKCPTAWTPVIVNGGHECLIVRARSIGDEIDPGSWSPPADRHVGQRNMSVVSAATAPQLIMSLEKTRLRTGKLQLVQVGAREAPPLVLLDRKLKIDPQIETHLLAELMPDGRLETPTTRPGMAATTATVGRAGVFETPTEVRQPFDVRRVVPTVLLPSLRTAPGTAGAVHALLDHHRNLPRDLRALLMRAAHPSAGHAQVLRIANLDEQGRMIGGYTMVIRG